MNTTPIVLKIGGNNLDEPDFIEQLAHTIAQSDVPIVLVHGGGKEISQMQEKLGLTPQYVDGLRVSDEPSLRVAEMVLCGAVNTRIVQALQKYGVEAQGLNGIDRGLITADKMVHPKGDLGRVGVIKHVRGDLIMKLIEDGVTPVIAPICLGDDGPFNVNADHVAGGVSKAINALEVKFITNVKGVMQDGIVLDHLTPMATEQLIEDEIIVGGMIPKVKTALDLLNKQIPQVTITDLSGVLSGTGTTFTPDKVTAA